MAAQSSQSPAGISESSPSGFHSALSGVTDSAKHHSAAADSADAPEMRDAILRIIAERLDIPRESLDVSARIEALGFSSLELIHAISDVQDHYGVYIPSAEFSHMMVPTVRLGDILEELIRFIHSSTAASDIPTPKPGHG